MKFVLASNNAKKLEELREILAPGGAELLSLSEAGVCSSPEETGVTFEENALIKALAALAASGLPAIADDSGLCVEALGGAPGVYSARYGDCGSDGERNALLLQNMEGVSDRSAYFVCVTACAFPNGDVLISRGECRGELLTAPRGEGGFGYDPLFLLPELGVSMAELSAAQKNKISHRAKALHDFSVKLEKYCEQQEGEILC